MAEQDDRRCDGGERPGVAEAAPRPRRQPRVVPPQLGPGAGPEPGPVVKLVEQPRRDGDRGHEREFERRVAQPRAAAPCQQSVHRHDETRPAQRREVLRGRRDARRREPHAGRDEGDAGPEPPRRTGHG
ncbi:MAG: hypothetical protein B7Z68_04765 [Acidobacteria bacterium 21-70-11]|nr:MAG: hypothetical protein B7Z68_04765 [Acidobacteria bacterium 21-70-11]